MYQAEIAVVGDYLLTQVLVRLVQEPVLLLPVHGRHRARAGGRYDAPLAERAGKGDGGALLVLQEHCRARSGQRLVQLVAAKLRDIGALLVEEPLAGHRTPCAEIHPRERCRHDAGLHVVRGEEERSARADIRLERGDVHLSPAVRADEERGRIVREDGRKLVRRLAAVGHQHVPDLAERRIEEASLVAVAAAVLEHRVLAAVFVDRLEREVVGREVEKVYRIAVLVVQPRDISAAGNALGNRRQQRDRSHRRAAVDPARPDEHVVEHLCVGRRGRLAVLRRRAEHGPRLVFDERGAYEPAVVLLARG